MSYHYGDESDSDHTERDAALARRILTAHGFTSWEDFGGRLCVEVPCGDGSTVTTEAPVTRAALYRWIGY